MAEPTLRQKVATALINAGFFYNSDQVDGLLADAVRYLSNKHPQRLREDEEFSTDASGKSLPDDFLELNPYDDDGVLAYDTGVFLYPSPISGSENPDGLEGVLASEFKLNIGGLVSTISFFNTINAGTVMRINYLGLWDVFGVDIPAYTHQAVKFLALYYASLERNTGTKMKREGDKEIQYNNEGQKRNYLDLALEEIKNFPSVGRASFVFQNLRAVRGSVR